MSNPVNNIIYSQSPILKCNVSKWITFSEFLSPVVLGDFYLEGGVFTDMGSEASERLPARATDTYQ